MIHPIYLDNLCLLQTSHPPSTAVGSERITENKGNKGHVFAQLSSDGRQGS